MKRIALSVAALSLLGLAGASFGGDAAAGKAVFTSKGCAGCHGPAGHSVAPQYPNLAGQNSQYVMLALKAYKDGKRDSANAAAMKPMAMMLSDTDIENVAAYVNSLK